LDRLQLVDVLYNEFSGVPEVIFVHLPLVIVYVVGKCDLPTGLFKANAHEADAGEKLREGLFKWLTHKLHGDVYILREPRSIL
jgi:hypothetical protein